MVKITTPEVIPGTFYFPKAQPGWNGPGITERVVVLTIARVKAVNIRFITPQQTIIIIVHVLIGLRCVKSRMCTVRRVIVVGLSHSKRCTYKRQTMHYHTAAV